MYHRLTAIIFVAFCSCSLVSCKATTVPIASDLATAVVPQEPPMPKIALVLGGGAARGFAHIGVIRALEKEKIPVDLIVGTSVGSLIGAIYAYEKNSFELEWTAFALEKGEFFDYGLLNAFTGMGLAKGDKLEAFVKNKIPIADIEGLKIPFVAVATDLNRGTRVTLASGSIARAVRASSAIPGVFQPVEHQGKLLVDGGVIDNLPVSVARERGADLVIAVDIGQQVANFKIENVIDVMLQSITIMGAENAKAKKREADILITPSIGDVGRLDFAQKKRCMQAGIEATEKIIPEIRARIEKWREAKLAQG